MQERVPRYFIRFCVDCREFGEPENTYTSYELKAVDEADARRQFHAWCRKNPKGEGHFPYSQKPYLEKQEVLEDSADPSFRP